MQRILLVALLTSLAACGFAANINIGDTIAQRGLFLAVMIVFWSGVLVSLTPCVYPMIPITLSIIGARSAEQKPIIGFLRSLVFVLGMAVVYTALGFFVANSSKGHGFIFQKDWFVAILAAFFVLMGLSMMDFFTIQMPAKWASKLQSGANRGGFIGAFMLGMVTGIVASPCGSPVLASILALAAASAKPAAGFILLFSYAMGIGMLFLLLGTFPSFLKSLPKSGVWMEDVKKFMGAVLIGVAIYYLRTVLPGPFYWGMVIAVSLFGAVIIAIKAGLRRQSPQLMFAWRLVGVGLAAYAVFVAFAKLPTAITGQKVKPFSSVEFAKSARETLQHGNFSADPVGTSAGATTGTAATVVEPVSDEWLTDEAAALAAAKQAGKPVIIDFGAEWCPACKELEADTFPVPEVAAVLRNFVKIRIDCTDETPENEALRAKYGAKELPTVVFLDKTGQVLPELTLKTFEPPADFIKRLQKVPQ